MQLDLENSPSLGFILDLADMAVHAQEQVGGRFGSQHCRSRGGGSGGHFGSGGCTASCPSWQLHVVTQEEVDLWVPVN